MGAKNIVAFSTFAAAFFCAIGIAMFDGMRLHESGFVCDQWVQIVPLIALLPLLRQ